MQHDIASTKDSNKVNVNSEYYPLYSELKTYAESYGGGLAALAQKVSISKPTLWRWVNFKNTKAPNPYHVLSLMRFMTKKKDIRETANAASSEVALYLENSFPGDFERTHPAEVVHELNVLLEDFYCYLVFLVTNTASLKSRNEVKKIVGIYSLEQLGLSIEDEDLNDDLLIRLGHIADVKIDKLIKNDILTEENGVLKSLCANPKLDLSITKAHIPKLFKFFKESNTHKHSNLMYGYQESIPRETIKKIVNLQFEAFMKCYKLMEETKTSDGELYILTTFFDSIDYK